MASTLTAVSAAGPTVEITEEIARRHGVGFYANGKLIFAISWMQEDPFNRAAPRIAAAFEDGAFYLDAGDRHIRRAMKSHEVRQGFLGVCATYGEAAALAESLAPLALAPQA